METFSEETKQAIIDAQNDYCAMTGCYSPIHSIHHKLKNTDYNRKKFPLFIHSIFNAIGLCFNCHKSYSHLFRVSDKLAEEYEKYLNHLFACGGDGAL